jgi:hypothetical protein
MGVVFFHNFINMRHFLKLFAIAIFIFSCNDNSSKKDEANSPIEKEPKKSLANQDIIGSYVGVFGENPDDNKIRLLITKVEGNMIEGSTIVGGNDRPFLGKINKENNLFLITASEPGDDKYDGSFDFQIDENKPEALTGTWKPFKNTVAPKKYALQKKTFSYDPQAGLYTETSTKLLSTSDVENLDKQTLSYMRNEIFARHGFCFKKKDIRLMFEMEEWYVPNTVDIKNYLTEVETKNIKLIQRYEKYAVDYGDEFGR